MLGVVEVGLLKGELRMTIVVPLGRHELVGVRSSSSERRAAVGELRCVGRGLVASHAVAVVLCRVPPR